MHTVLFFVLAAMLKKLEKKGPITERSRRETVEAMLTGRLKAMPKYGTAPRNPRERRLQAMLDGEE